MPAIQLQVEGPAALGNAMFQYAYLKQLQKRLINSEVRGFRIPQFGIESEKIELPGRILRVVGGHNHSLDHLASLLERHIYDHLSFYGFVQRLEFYRNRLEICSYFPSPNNSGVPSIGRSQLLINIRGE